MQVKTGLAPVNGAQLYYEVAGAGQPLILLHAGVADCRMWDEQFSVFAKQYRVIRYDLRGFGRSAMPEGRFSNHDDVVGRHICSTWKNRCCLTKSLWIFCMGCWVKQGRITFT